MQLFTLENQYLKLTLTDLGASWLSCRVKLPQGEREVLVSTTPQKWQTQTAYFGATIGRYANRIANACYTLNGQTFQLAQNNGKHNLHGGQIGADKKRWQAEFLDPQAVRFCTQFAHLEEGFGGNVQASVIYRLKENEVVIEFEALSDAATPLCLTNHAYFNLQGFGSVLDHQLTLLADYYLPVDSEGIPNAPLKAVVGTSFDFRQAKKLGQDWLKEADQRLVKGYDHAFLLAKQTAYQAKLTVSDLSLEIFTSKPALQLYTGNWLSGEPNQAGGFYENFAGVALEPGCLPDTPNHPEWWHLGGISQANEPYQHQIRYRFIF